MWISSYAIRRPIMTVVVMLALVGFGAIALIRIQTDEFPAVTAPVINVAVGYPGASPAVVERELLTPLEKALRAISGVDRVMSTAFDGYTNLTVVFAFEKNIQQAAQDVRDKLAEARGELPAEITEPVVTRVASQDFPILSLTLTSRTLPLVELTQLAESRVRRELTALPGVAAIDLFGGVARELTVELSADALRASGIPVARIVQVLQAENLAVPVGKLSGDLEDRTIRLRGRIAGPDDFAQLVVERRGDQVIRLGDLANVRDAAQEATSAAMYDTTAGVGLDLRKAMGYSTTDVSARVLARVAELRCVLPAGVQLDVVRDSAARVSASVGDVKTSLIEGAVLTILVVFVFLKSWRSTVITGLALPISVLASFIAVSLFGFTLNVMSLLGLSLAIGILVDDAIVVRENIVRHMELGKDHVRAAHDGTAEIGLAVAATTFSIVAVFVPIAFMGGAAEQWFAPFALTVACSVLVSLFVSFSLDPMLSAVWHDPDVAGGLRRSWLSRKFETFDRGFDRLTRWYRRVITWALRHRLAMVALALAAFIGALAIPAAGLVGSGFFPVEDRSEFQINLETSPGSSLEYTRSKVLAIVEAVRRRPEVRFTYATIGGPNGTDTAQIYVRLVPRHARATSQEDVAQAVRDELRRFTGTEAYVLTNAFSMQKRIQIQLVGADIDVLNDIAERVAGLARTVPGAVDVGLSSKGQRVELEITPDRELSGRLGVSAASLAQALRPAFAGLKAGRWIDPNGDARDVVVRLGLEWRRRPEDLESLPVALDLQGAGGPRTIELGQVARITRGLGPALIEHLDGSRVVTVGANVEGLPLSQVVGALERRLAEIEFPAGYARYQGGETRDQTEVFGRILIALGTAVALMYFILVVQFGSFVAPISIMASLPLSLIGVMLAMLATGSTLNLMSMIGVILLMGIVAKNAILLIDFARRAEAAGMPRGQAIAEAGAVRLRPIIMTSVAIIAGMIPVAIGTGEGADFRAPLGRAVIGGVITSTILTLLVIPTFYAIVARGSDWIVGLRRRGHVANQ